MTPTDTIGSLPLPTTAQLILQAVAVNHKQVKRKTAAEYKTMPEHFAGFLGSLETPTTLTAASRTDVLLFLSHLEEPGGVGPACCAPTAPGANCAAFPRARPTKAALPPTASATWRHFGSSISTASMSRTCRTPNRPSASSLPLSLFVRSTALTVTTCAHCSTLPATLVTDCSRIGFSTPRRAGRPSWALCGQTSTWTRAPGSSSARATDPTRSTCTRFCCASCATTTAGSARCRPPALPLSRTRCATRRPRTSCSAATKPERARSALTGFHL